MNHSPRTVLIPFDHSQLQELFLTCPLLHLKTSICTLSNGKRLINSIIQLPDMDIYRRKYFNVSLRTILKMYGCMACIFNISNIDILAAFTCAWKIREDSTFRFQARECINVFSHLTRKINNIIDYSLVCMKSHMGGNKFVYGSVWHRLKKHFLYISAFMLMNDETRTRLETRINKYLYLRVQK